MPDMDNTGPVGTGPIGRGMGPCGDGEPGRGRGNHFRRGGGAGWGRIAERLSPEEEKIILERHKSRLEARLVSINERLQSLEKPGAEQ